MLGFCAMASVRRLSPARNCHLVDLPHLLPLPPRPPVCCVANISYKHSIFELSRTQALNISRASSSRQCARWADCNFAALLAGATPSTSPDAKVYCPLNAIHAPGQRFVGRRKLIKCHVERVWPTSDKQEQRKKKLAKTAGALVHPSPCMSCRSMANKTNITALGPLLARRECATSLKDSVSKCGPLTAKGNGCPMSRQLR